MAHPLSDQPAIAVVIYPGVTLLDVVGTFSFLVPLTQSGRYRLVTVGERCEPTATDTPLRLTPDQTFAELPRPALLLVPGGLSAGEALHNPVLLDYLRTASAAAELIGGINTGALLLAAAGLLTGRPATTHWAYREQLEALGAGYVQKPWVEDGRFVTAAGVSGGLDLALQLVTRRVSPAAARMAQTMAEYEPRPPFGGLDWRQTEGAADDYRRRLSEPARPSAEAREIAFVLYPGLTPLDLAGPLQILSALALFAPQYRPVVVAQQLAPVRSDNGLTLWPDRTLAEVPRPFALVVPGGGTPTLRAMNDPAIRAYVRGAAGAAAYVTSVCTGALILAGAGLLEGRPATTHWAFYKVLERLGSPYRRERWVDHGRVINSAGVSAGIDMALHLAARLTDEATARRVQLALHYDPQPPLGPIDWGRLALPFRILRAALTLAAPFIAARPQALLRQGR